jgi:hypothetical protein
MSGFMPALINMQCTVEGVGVGEESQAVHKSFEEAMEHFFKPITMQRTNPRMKFLMLKSQWEADTAPLSSITKIAMHPAYQQIIGMGSSAVPLILSEMQGNPGHWFWALKSITGEDPTSFADRGRIRAMTESWLRWGRDNGYLV